MDQTDTEIEIFKTLRYKAFVEICGVVKDKGEQYDNISLRLISLQAGFGENSHSRTAFWTHKLGFIANEDKITV